MAQITMGGNPVQTSGELPSVGADLPAVTLTDVELNDRALRDYQGQQLLLNIFPSVGTGVCSQAVRTFNEKAAGLSEVKVLNISMDLPFAQKQFCAAEGIENVEMLSDFRHRQMGDMLGLFLQNGPFAGLLARAVIIVSPDQKITYTELVPEIGQEPNYDAALKALS